jgi:hypothetical protein
MWRAERRERGAQLGRGDGDVAGVDERRLHESARLVVGAVVARREPADEIDPGLVRDHLDHVREVLALGDELDNAADAANAADRDPRAPNSAR